MSVCVLVCVRARVCVCRGGVGGVGALVFVRMCLNFLFCLNVVPVFFYGMCIICFYLMYELPCTMICISMYYHVYFFCIIVCLFGVFAYCALCIYVYLYISLFLFSLDV